MHAIILLAHFHALSSIVFSCGIEDDGESPTGCVVAQPPGAQDTSVNSNNGTTADTAAAIKREQAPPESSPSDLTPPPSPGSEEGTTTTHATVEALVKKMISISEQRKECDETTDEDLVKGFQDVVTTHSAEIAATPAKDSPTAVDPDLLRFVDDDYSFGYIDFALWRREEKDLPSFRVQDCSWGKPHDKSPARRS